MPRCPYCGSWDLELEYSYDSVLSGKSVAWYLCQSCGNDVEVVDGITTPAEAKRDTWDNA